MTLPVRASTVPPVSLWRGPISFLFSADLRFPARTCRGIFHAYGERPERGPGRPGRPGEPGALGRAGVRAIQAIPTIQAIQAFQPVLPIQAVSVQTNTRWTERREWPSNGCSRAPRHHAGPVLHITGSRWPAMRTCASTNCCLTFGLMPTGVRNPARSRRPPRCCASAVPNSHKSQVARHRSRASRRAGCWS